MLFLGHYRSIVLYLCLTVASAYDAVGQNYLFRHYKQESGLSYNWVNCSLQDNNGFLWFGTLDGLDRFDGHNFKIFRSDPQKAFAIGNNFISAIYQDKNNTIWVGTHNGLFEYHSKTENFDRVGFTFPLWIESITADNDDNLWFICNAEIYKYNLKTKAHVVYRVPDPYSITSTKDGEIWTGDKDGYLERYDQKTDSFEKFYVFSHSGNISSKHIDKIFDAGQGLIFIGTRDQGAKLFDIRTRTYKDIITHNANGSGIGVSDFARYSVNEYWIATTTGIYIYNLETNKITQITKNDLDPSGLSDNNILSLCKDSEGGIWATTKFGGINYYHKQNTLFDIYAARQSREHFNNNVIREMYPDKNGNLWVGTEDDGLCFLDTKTNRLTRYHIFYKNISGLFVENNELWIGKNEEGLDVVDINTGRLLRTYNKFSGANGLKSNFVTCLYKTPDGKLLAGTTNGLYLYNPSTKDFKIVDPATARLSVSCLTADHDGNIWIGTFFSGVHYLDMHSLKVKSIQLDFSDKGRFNNTVTSVLEDNYHNIWLSTESSGLWRYTPPTGALRIYDRSNGMPSDNTFKILADEKNKLWISTSAGIAYLDPQTGSVTVFTKANGLPGDQFNYNSGYKATDGRLYFGSTQGLVSFRPDNMAYQYQTPPIYITGIQINSKDIEVGPGPDDIKSTILTADHLSLPYSLSSFSVDFAALSYIAPDLIHYAYKLNGLDKNWTYLSTNRRAYFTRLPPGNYLFKIKSSVTQGKWGAERELRIIIDPPWWLSWWAYTCYICLTAGCIVVIIFYYHKKTKRKSEELIRLLEHEKDKEVYEAKIDFFTNIAHEIRTPLTLIAAPLEKIETSDSIAEIRNHAQVITSNTNRLVNLANQLLDFRKTENKGFRLNFIKTDVNVLLNDIFGRFAFSASQKKLAYTLKTAPGSLYSYLDPEALNKIVSNLIHNAIKYASHSVTVSLKIEPDDFFTVEISNDGPLIPENLREKVFEPFYRLKNAEHINGTGIGLALARSLTHLHNGTLNIKTGQTANIFILKLPIHQEIEFDLTCFHTPQIAAEGKTHRNDPKTAILLVEDNPDILNFLCNEIKNDYKVFTATSGEEAIGVLNEQAIQLIVSDVMMPGMDGFELCRLIKNNLDMCHIPIILLTAKSSVQSKIIGLDLGADVYIEKPFSPKHLLAQISSLLSNRINVKQHFATSPVAGISTIAYSKPDAEFLNKLNRIILNNIANVDLGIDELADGLNVSRRSLIRKIKSISGLTATEMITLIRLKKSAEILLDNHSKIYQIAELVGFKSRGNFTRSFNRQFGMSPSDFIKKNSKEPAMPELDSSTAGN